MAAGIKVSSRQDVFAVQDGHQFIARKRLGRRLAFDDDVMIIVFFRRIVLRKRDARQIAQMLVVEVVIAPIAGAEIFETFQGSQPHGRRDLGHFRVDADGGNLIDAGEAEVSRQAELGGQRFVVGDQGAALEGVQDLRGVKAQDFERSETAQHLALEGAAQRMRTVEKQLQAMLVGQFGQGRNIAGASPNMHAENSRGPLGDERSHLLGVDRVRRGVNIAEYGRDALPGQRVRRGHEGEGRQDDLSRES